MTWLKLSLAEFLSSLHLLERMYIVWMSEITVGSVVFVQICIILVGLDIQNLEI